MYLDEADEKVCGSAQLRRKTVVLFLFGGTTRRQSAVQSTAVFSAKVSTTEPARHELEQELTRRDLKDLDQCRAAVGILDKCGKNHSRS